MRSITPFRVALLALATLAGCGTKTPLSMPPAPPAAAKAAVPPAPTIVPDDSNKAAAPRP
jgi:predicted small lipoprotein YifL